MRALLLAALLAAGDVSADFLKNGDFREADAAGWPRDWERGEPAEGEISRESDDVPFMRLVATQPGELVLMFQTVPVPEGVRGLEFHARFRTAGVKFGKNFLCDARTRFSFLDAAGNRVEKGPGDLIFSSHAKEWTDGSKKFLVPPGAVSLRVNLCLNRPASGTLDVAAVRLVAMDAKEAGEMAEAPALAEKKKAADEQEIVRLREAPPRSEPLRVSGNRIVGPAGKPVLLQGVNVPSLEWSEKGENVHRSVKVALLDWKANIIRLPVSANFWAGKGKNGEGSNDAEAYRAIVDGAVRMAAGQGAHVLLDLHSYGGPKPQAAAFWKDAAARYANNPAVLFDLFNEPHGISWELWRNGGEHEVTDKKTKETKTVQVVGMQSLVETVRATGAKNLIVAGGLSHALDLSGVLEGFALTDPGGNGIVYATHFYNWHRNWEKNFLKVAEKYPVIVGEFGADVKKMPFVPAKNQEDPHTWMPDALGMIQKYQLHWTAFSLHPKATPVLIKNWDYEPTPFFGAYVKDALAGKTFEPAKLR